MPALHSQTYHNGHIDIPTDHDLDSVATEVVRKLQAEWPLLQSHLGVPDHVMLDVFHQRNIQVQVFRMLKEWRSHSKDCSKENLASCLRSADGRLENAALMLTSDSVAVTDDSDSARGRRQAVLTDK